MEASVSGRGDAAPVGSTARSNCMTPLGERAGLVAAQNVDAAEVLNGRQMFDDHLVTRHPQRALRERDGADHREELRREADAQRHGEEQRLERVVLERDAHQQDEQDEHDGRPKDQQTESPQPVFELRLRRTGPQPHGDVAEHRLRAGRDGQRRSGAADDRRAEEHQMRRVGARRVAQAVGGGDLVGGQRLAGQHRLLNGEIARLEQACVRGHEIAGRQPEDVARHDVRAAASRATPHRGARVAVGITDARSRSAACCDR